MPNQEDNANLLPVRMLNEFAYCPRLFHLMHVEGQWADNVYTVEGRHAHRRVDKLDHVLPNPEETTTKAKKAADDGDGDAPPVVSRSVSLSSEKVGLTGKLDLVSTAGTEAVPVETKRGRVPGNPERSWEPERIQVMAQGLLLREHGYACDHGVLYFQGSHTRVDIPFTPQLESRTLSLIAAARRAMLRRELPRPLNDSPKCYGCSLSGICLPDETLALQAVPRDPTAPKVRRLYPAREDALPLYIQEQGAQVGKSRKSLIVRKSGQKLAEARLKDVSQLVLCGNIQITAQTIHLLCEAGIPIVHLSSGHWFYGITSGITLRNGYNRAAQYEAAASPSHCLEFALEIVHAKGTNQRTLLRRNATPRPEQALCEMSRQLKHTSTAESLNELLGFEGTLASNYFEQFSNMLHPRDFDANWSFENRNRRPPKDPVNAMLSFGYALLVKECTSALLAEGLDPWWGFYHQPRHGKPALALDLMEEFRPIIVDSAVLTAINTGMVASKDFIGSQAGCVMKPSARKSLIQAYEARMDQLMTHPLFDYRCSWRAIVRMQARLISRWLRGDIPRYTGMITR
jgi:CRISPR-associated protein Cas1